MSISVTKHDTYTFPTSNFSVDDLRRNSLNLTSTHGFQVKDQTACRVEYLPIQWYSCLRDDRYGIDKYVT